MTAPPSESAVAGGPGAVTGSAAAQAVHRSPLTRVAVALAVARWLPLLTVMAVVAAVLHRLGTQPSDLLRYVAYACWAVLLPGTLVYRALRRSPHSLVDDLAMGAAVGLVLELGAFVTYSVSGLSALLWTWPLLVVTPFVVTPRLRRHWRPTVTGYRRAPILWSCTVAGVALYLFGYLTAAFLRFNPPVPTTRATAYHLDELYQLGLAGEAKHHFPLQTPAVAGEPLGYHWFAFADMASASTISGVDTAVVFFRLAVPAYCLLAVLLLGVVGWRVSGRPMVGALAALLGFAVGEVALGSFALSALGATTAYTVWSSVSVPYGWLMTIPLIALLIDRLTGGLPDAPIGRGAWAGIGMFAVAAAGAKASAVPVAICGVGLVAAAELIRRRWNAPTWTALGILLAAFLFAMAAVYRFQSQRMRVRPFGILEPFLSSSHDRTAGRAALVLGFVLIGYVLYMGCRLAGIPVLFWLRRARWGTTEWFLLGGISGGAAATLVLSHEHAGQNYFIRSGWAFGAILSAWGLVALIDKHRVSPWVASVICAAAGLFACVSSMELHGVAINHVGGQPYRRMALIYLPVVAALAVGLAVALTVAIARRRRPGLRGLGALTVLALLLGAGLPTLVWDAKENPNAGHWYHDTIDPEQAAAARWLRKHSGADDIIATNAICADLPTAQCISITYWLPAFSERRFLIAGWGYSARADADAERLGLPVTATPFWDRQLLAANQAAFYTPDRAGLDGIWRRGVRWLIVDREYGHESPTLRDLAQLRYDNGRMAVYRIGEVAS